MTVVSELLVAYIKLAELQARVGLVTAEVAALRVRQMLEPPSAEADEPIPPSFEAVVDAAARAIKAKLLGGRDIGFNNMLRVNFPDDQIRAIAEAALIAARGIILQPS
jgi:hypothetical protein